MKETWLIYTTGTRLALTDILSYKPCMRHASNVLNYIEDWRGHK